MINKKKINIIKTENFLEKFPIIILLQHNNLTVNDWLNLKKKIIELVGSDAKTSTIEILSIKNSLLKKILLGSHSLKIPNSSQGTVSFFCQGPNFIIGCKNENHLKSIWNFINSNSKFLFISCLYKNQLLNHLDLKILLETNQSIYNSFINNLDKKTDLYNVLRHNLTLHPLIRVQENLINIFYFIKESKR